MKDVDVTAEQVARVTAQNAEDTVKILRGVMKRVDKLEDTLNKLIIILKNI